MHQTKKRIENRYKDRFSIHCFFLEICGACSSNPPTA
jgi:hypothetical protein